ncbi:MAG TPA: ATP-binding protein, partial [Gaiellaceae bacterium]|nr:ATP-binding protein [Gaiellaceae bacterium]
SPARRPADVPALDGGALVEHLVDRAARADRELRIARSASADAERDRALLGRAARLLAEQPAGSIADLVRLFLPVLGQWCVVDELIAGEATRRVVALDPEVARAGAPLEGVLRLAGDAPIGIARALRRGRIERLASLPSADVGGTADDRLPYEEISRFATGPLLVVPVASHGRVVAALTFGRGHDEPEYDELAQRLAADLASFVTVALEQRQLVDAAASAGEAKAQFLTMMSHELRTPLNAIAGYAQLLDMGFRGPLNENQRDAVARILRGQEHLLELVDAVLTFSRLTSGKLVLETAAVPAVSLLEDASEPYLPQFSAHGITFRLVRCPDGTSVRADAEHALQVLRHLVANALKFTRRGGTVTLSCEVGIGVVRFVVADTGRGIPAAQRESIFQPFVQVEKGLTRSVDGSGLGLAVGRELAPRMGGTLTVTSELGVGSRFVLTLPSAGGQAPPPSIDSLPGQG